MFDLAAHLASELETGWSSLARPSQLPPPGGWTIWLILAGRGFGKTRAAAEWVRSNVESGNAKSVAIIGSTAADVRDTCVEGSSGILSICPDWNRPIYEPSKRRLTWPNGAWATMYSGEEPDRLRGPNHDLAWCDELASWSNQHQTWDNLMMTLRAGTHPRCIITTTPKPSKLLKSLIERRGQDVVITGGSTYENRSNLARSFFASIINRYEGTRLGRQELDAEYLEDLEGALWSRSLIEELRVQRGQVPELKRIVVAIDPAVSCGEDSDETGIVVCGLGADNHGYVLEDASGKYLPPEWARRAIALYNKYGAERIVAEQNQGGVMVEMTLRAVEPNVSYRGVHAARGKLVRAEPIAALFEQRRCHIVGAWPVLEDQMCSYAGGGDSPDHLDAMVFALTELMSGIRTDGIIDFYRSLVEEDRALAEAAVPGSAAARAEAATVIFRAPEGLSNVFTMSGRRICIDVDRLVKVSERDAVPLRQAGWEEVEHAPLA
jgi:predicted phage terminase large subunit-like protein